MLTQYVIVAILLTLGLLFLFMLGLLIMLQDLFLRVGGSLTLPPLTDPTVQISRSGFFKTDSPSGYE